MLNMQTTTQHQQMGYDRAASMFAPDGRLLQVEYANKTVKQGTATIAFVCSDGVLIVADKRVNDKLMVSKSKEKIYQIDEHIACAVSGLVADGMVLIDRAQVKAQQHRISYDNPIDILSIVKDICSYKQITTQSGGYRPFGVSLLFAGVDDDGAQIYVTEPSGVYFQYKAAAIGEFESEIKDKLREKFKDGSTTKTNLKLAFSIFKEVKKEDYNVELLDVAVIDDKKRQYKKLDSKEVSEMLK
jgi:proteasome alpha subunit